MDETTAARHALTARVQVRLRPKPYTLTLTGCRRPNPYPNPNPNLNPNPNQAAKEAMESAQAQDTSRAAELEAQRAA